MYPTLRMWDQPINNDDVTVIFYYDYPNGNPTTISFQVQP